MIVSAISPLRADRASARALFSSGQFFEVYVSTSFSVCARRDSKGLYEVALLGGIKDFTGLDGPYEAPQQTDYELNTDEAKLVDAVQQLVSMVFKK